MGRDRGHDCFRFLVSFSHDAASRQACELHMYLQLYHSLHLMTCYGETRFELGMQDMILVILVSPLTCLYRCIDVWMYRCVHVSAAGGFSSSWVKRSGGVSLARTGRLALYSTYEPRFKLICAKHARRLAA